MALGAAHPLAWLPPFAVGLAAAVAGELSVGLLLYSTPGFLRALTLVLAVLLGSLALGLWTAPRRGAGVEGVRRRWLFALVAYAGAAAASGAWTARGGLATTGLDRGFGLALLAALPLYACGALLAAITDSVEDEASGARVAAPSLAGAATGALLTGLVLIPNLVPVSIYSLCLALISGGALVHGRVLSGHSETRVLGTLPSRRGEVRVEERSWGRPRRRERLLLENGRARGAEDEAGRPLSAWEWALLEWLPSRPDGAGDRLLFLGGGAETLPRLLLEARPDLHAVVVEPNAAVAEAARLHFGAPAGDPRLVTEVGDPEAAITDGQQPLGLVVADARALAPTVPVPQLDPAWLAALRARMAAGGALLLGGVDERAARGAPLDGLLEEGRRAFPYVSVHASPAEDARAGELLVVLATDEIAGRWRPRGWRTVLEADRPVPLTP